MLVRLLLFLIAGCTTALAAAQVAPSSSFRGTWQFDPERSTNLPAWRSLELTVELDATTATLQRRLGWGRRVHQESMTLPLDGRVTAVPVPYWADNRHIGAYIGGDRHKQSELQVLDGGRLLRIESNLVLETQQGERPVNILSDYHLSPDGQTLTLIEIRSTRPRPTVAVFNRVRP